MIRSHSSLMDVSWIQKVKIYYLHCNQRWQYGDFKLPIYRAVYLFWTLTLLIKDCMNIVFLNLYQFMHVKLQLQCTVVSNYNIRNILKWVFPLTFCSTSVCLISCFHLCWFFLKIKFKFMIFLIFYFFLDLIYAH